MHARTSDKPSQHREIGQNWSLVAVAAAAGLAWVIRYALRYGLDIADPPAWAQWFDQGWYVTSARALSHGDLSAAQHWYPLAYPIMAAPFARILPNEPFFLPDLALFIATALIFVKVMRRLGMNALTATILLLLGDMAIRKIAGLWTVPWTTSLSSPLIWGLIEQVLSIVDTPPDRAPPRMRAMLLLGVTAAALPIARPTDGLLAVLAVAFAAIMLRRQHRLRITGLGWMCIGSLALCIPYGLLYLAIYGPHLTDYMRDAAQQGFAFGDLPWKTYVIVVSAAPWFPASPSLVEAMPWILPGCAGLVITLIHGKPQARIALSLIALLAIPYCATFIAYTDLQPPGLWSFGNAHYFKWLFPLFAAGCWLWLREFRSWRGAGRAIVVLALFQLPACLRPIPTLVADKVPARMLMFRGATDRPWQSAYFSPATITDEQGSMANVNRFHQVPDDHGERAIAVWRLFAGRAVRNDPNEAAVYRNDEPPYARYATRLSFGVPCWVRSRPECRLPGPPTAAR